jgi:8-oxo-dGTP pyrophosphatase MutT (NUDIX family)
VIHRPRRDDWSLPKGKVDAGETLIACARREVDEETGLSMAVQHHLGRIQYRVGDAPKTVDFWAMRYLDGLFVANEEADELRWAPAADASALLTFRSDRDVVARFVRAGCADSAVLLVRHAKAGKRSAWRQDDDLRPLEAAGRQQAIGIAEFGRLFAPTMVATAIPLRCRQTVEPLATRLGLTLTEVPEFSDATYEKDPSVTELALETLARAEGVAVVCAQGGAIPGVLDRTQPAQAPHDSRKGSVWAMFYRRGALVAADYYGRV